MKKLIAILVLLLCVSAYAEDMQKYLKDTQDLVFQGKYQEALDRYIWFHDHALEHNQSMYGVRLSFALAYWKQLGDVYPPALAALATVRDNKTALLEEGKGNFNLFHDVLAINRTLGDERKTVDLFRKLDQEQSDLAKQCWDSAKEVVIKAKAYDLAKKYIGDPMREFAKTKSMYDLNTTMYGQNNLGDQFKSYNENRFVEEIARLIAVELALDDTKAAREIQEKALAVLDDPRLRDAIPN
jgi:hypothetical protein